MAKKKSPRVIEVLVNRGESQFTIDAETTIDSVIDQGATMLNKACLANTVVFKAADGQHYLGQFGFSLEKVSPLLARRLQKELVEEGEE